MRRVFLQIAVLAAIPASAAAQAPDTTRWTIVLGERKAGEAKGWAMPDGELRFASAFNDRGRGSQLETRLRLGAGGVPVRVHTTGVDYFKNPVEETFEVVDGRARWRSQAESGEKTVSGPAIFLPINDASETGILVRALLAAPGRSLPLLPDGRATLEPAGELQVTANGETRTVRQWLIGGTGFEPFPVWMTTDDRYFGTAQAWGGIVEAGWEAVLPQLVRAQTAAQARRYAAMADSLRARRGPVLVFRNVGVFDPAARMVRPGWTVVIRDGRIAAAGPDVAVPAGASVVEGAGKTLIPGLWDMHTHVDPLDGLMHIAAGVTSVRDLGNDTTTVLELKRRWDAGEHIGPRLAWSGFIDGPGPFTGPTGWKASNPAEAIAAVEAYRRLGAEQIKVYSSLDTALVPVIVQRAHALGMRVSGHIPWPLPAERAVAMGVDEIQHGNFLLLNFLGDSIDTRTPARFAKPAQMGADLDLASPRVQAFIALLRDRRITVDPTLSVFEGMFTGRKGQVSPDFTAVADRLPPNVRRGLLRGGIPVPEGMDERYRESFRRMTQLVGALHRAGVRIVPGTDAMAGFALHRELELYVQAGIPAADVLHLATLGSAEVLRRDRELGSIAPGKLADVVLLDGDPTRDISAVRRAVLVVKNGVAYEPDRLYRAIGVAPLAARR
ncbi:MAG TPA: amidohydrolase family protein [Longimicrobium sp.]|nr:amidohydrolase family protein [Longimicrobium sp.]